MHPFLKLEHDKVEKSYNLFKNSTLTKKCCQVLFCSLLFYILVWVEEAIKLFHVLPSLSMHSSQVTQPAVLSADWSTIRNQQLCRSMIKAIQTNVWMYVFIKTTNEISKSWQLASSSDWLRYLVSRVWLPIETDRLERWTFFASRETFPSCFSIIDQFSQWIFSRWHTGASSIFNF